MGQEHPPAELAFEEFLTPAGKGSVPGDVRVVDRLADVRELRARCIGPVEGDVGRFVDYFRLATRSSEPPAGSDRPALIRARSALSTHPSAESTNGGTRYSDSGSKACLWRRPMRESAMTGKRSDTNDVQRSTSKPALRTFPRSSFRR